MTLVKYNNKLFGCKVELKKRFDSPIFDPLSEDRIFIGHIIGIRDVVGFHGESVAKLEKSFQEAVM